ncbi:LysR family transcriptional regulator [Marinobacterium arenosum]|uniref:LysR family transcriptional regulator n=1 Tax=Marinobacterium arenosum TaxID=2862496 RepID=UPI001C97A056|nr:LysR substrate-binding domain-containing protein [Marinobacterium arenosum]MBY4678787.1 LysR family transcriptional regulator [Marinobacterium arenosum]
MHFDLRDLELFVCIAESNSLTRGSKRANISAAAASNRIKGLEGQLNSRLFYRDSRGMSLTPAGSRLLKHAISILQRISAVKQDFSTLGGEDSGHLRILANTTAVTEILPDVLADFLSQRPGVSIDLQEELNNNIVKNILEGAADLGIISDEVQGTGLEVIPFTTDNLLLAVPFDSELARLDRLSFFETLTEPHICLHEGSSLFSFLQNVARQIGGNLKPRVQVFGFESVCRMVESGVGIGVIPESSAIRHARTMRIKLVELSDTWAKRCRCIILKDLENLPKCGQELINDITQRYS